MISFKILATDASGQRVECFTWTRDAASGIERAEREAQDFGRSDLSDFRAVPTGEAICAMFAKYDLIRLQNHSVNVSQDHLTICGFFTHEIEFTRLAERLRLNIERVTGEESSV